MQERGAGVQPMGDDMYSATHRPHKQSSSRRNGGVSRHYQGPKAYKEAFAEIAAKPPIFQKAVTKRPRLQDLRPTLRLARQGGYCKGDAPATLAHAHSATAARLGAAQMHSGTLVVLGRVPLKKGEVGDFVVICQGTGGQMHRLPTN
ncbi:hypothetical protein PMIN01_10168 [Paraphaeosphaeria minitans]|uniref:Uncharacterized protein n=1 Tax=Paraphaeosphaeria minitans TaxID=565426 RepID=A0A9P6GB97_9PLEO|nr:hypothetical protein PMIN01_10168 [Paraphaeosphaeria minitans]